MIVVEFDLQFLFVVSIKFFRKISQTSGLSGADPPPVLTVLLKTVRF